MIGWGLRRLIQAGIIVLLMTIIVFIGLHLIGNPADILIGPEADQRDREMLITQLGLDLPIWQQYWRFLVSALHGDLGYSFVYNQPALELVLQRLPATIELAFAALIIALVIGIPLGLIAGLYPESLFSKIVMTGSILGFSLPTFWIGLMLIMAFSVSLGWLPAGGRGDTVTIFGLEWSFLTGDGLYHLILPAFNLALFKISLVIRLTFAGVQEIVPQDYIKFARAKGLSPARIIRVHIFRNLLIPLVTVVGLELGATIAGAVVTESIFAWPGAGKLILDSINQLDRPVILAYLIIIVCLFVTINFLVDVTYRIVDPRARKETTV